MPYVTPYAPGETRLLTLTNNANVPGELRIVRKFLTVDWERVWKTFMPVGFLTQ